MSLKLSLCLLSPLFIDYREIQGDDDTKGTRFELVLQILFCYNNKCFSKDVYGPLHGTIIPVHKSGDQTDRSKHYYQYY